MFEFKITDLLPFSSCSVYTLFLATARLYRVETILIISVKHYWVSWRPAPKLYRKTSFRDVLIDRKFIPELTFKIAYTPITFRIIFHKKMVFIVCGYTDKTRDLLDRVKELWFLFMSRSVIVFAKEAVAECHTERCRSACRSVRLWQSV